MLLVNAALIGWSEAMSEKRTSKKEGSSKKAEQYWLTMSSEELFSFIVHEPWIQKQSLCYCDVFMKNHHMG